MSFISDVVDRIEKKWELSHEDAMKEVKIAISEMLVDSMRKYLKGAELSGRPTAQLFRDLKDVNLLQAQLEEARVNQTKPVEPAVVPVPKKGLFTK